MGTQRRRIAVWAGVTVFALLALASLASGTLPVPLELLGAILPAVVIGLLLYALLPVFGFRR